MATILQETRFELRRGELVTLSDAGGHTLECLSGELWITLDGDSRDVILAPGRSCSLDSNRLVVVSALRPSAMKLLRYPALDPRASGARQPLVSLNWEFPPLAAFPSPLIR